MPPTRPELGETSSLPTDVPSPQARSGYSTTISPARPARAKTRPFPMPRAGRDQLFARGRVLFPSLCKRAKKFCNVAQGLEYCQPEKERSWRRHEARGARRRDGTL